MKRAFTILIFAITFSNLAIAQLADGSIGPDFTATDINGVEHNLYDLLNAGKSVVLDMSATWCPPCWDYHTEGVLKDVWEQYGPDGTNEMYIFMIEGDVDTDMADLMGTTVASEGDWITGTPYPIIDNNIIASDYAVTYYPTLYHICPNKIVTELDLISAAQYYNLHTGCPDWVVGNNNVGNAQYSGDLDLDCGIATDVTPAVTFRNMGASNLTSCTVEFLMDGQSVQTQDWTGNIETLETAEVEFNDVAVLNTAEFSFVVSAPNGTSDDDNVDNISSQLIGVSSKATTIVEFEMRTDFWPAEISWELIDNNGVVLYSNADLGPLNCDQVYNQTYELIDGECYTFSIEDDFGDGLLDVLIDPAAHNCGTANGMANQAMGAVSLTSGNVVMWNDIDYGSGTEINFVVETPVATKEVSFNALDIYPNPATDNVTVEFDIAATTELEVAIYNVYGQQVITTGFNQYVTGSNTVNVETAILATGIYFISISEGDKITSRKISILK